MLHSHGVTQFQGQYPDITTASATSSMVPCHTPEVSQYGTSSSSRSKTQSNENFPDYPSFDYIDPSGASSCVDGPQPWISQSLPNLAADETNMQLPLHDLPLDVVWDQPGSAFMNSTSLSTTHHPTHDLTALTCSNDSDALDVQKLVPTSIGDQTAMQPISTGSSLKQRPALTVTQSVSSSHRRLQNNPPISHSMISPARKRQRPTEPSVDERLSAVRQTLAKRTGVPEVSLPVFCVSQPPASKRTRTCSQKQEKKQVESAGGSCFLCRITKRKV